MQPNLSRSATFLIVSSITISACSDVLYYQETPIRRADYELLERATTLCVEIERVYLNNPKNAIEIVEVSTGRFNDHTYDVTSKALAIWGTEQISHPSQPLADKFTSDLETRFGNKTFHFINHEPGQSCPPIIADGAFDNRMALEMKTTSWNLILGNGGEYHLTYYARVRLIDRGQHRVMWVQTCSDREIWPGGDISRMKEQEIRALLATLQTHALEGINSCSRELIKHLELLG